MTEGLKLVLKEMCKRVGTNFNSVDFKDPNWYNQYSWSMDEETNFIEWLANALMTNKTVRMDLLVYPSHLTYNKARKAAKEFVLNYGWRYPRTNKDQDYYE